MTGEPDPPRGPVVPKSNLSFLFGDRNLDAERRGEKPHLLDVHVLPSFVVEPQ